MSSCLFAQYQDRAAAPRVRRFWPHPWVRRRVDYDSVGLRRLLRHSGTASVTPSDDVVALPGRVTNSARVFVRPSVPHELREPRARERTDSSRMREGASRNDARGIPAEVSSPVAGPTSESLFGGFGARERLGGLNRW